VKTRKDATTRHSPLSTLARLRCCIGFIALWFCCGSTQAGLPSWDDTPPAFRIGASNGIVTLSWPTWAVNFNLESKPGPADDSEWVGFWSVKSIVGDEIVTSVAATNTQQFFRLATPAFVPVFQFGMFYNGDLELNGAATLHLRGRVHSNSNLYTGAVSSQYFYRDVTVAGDIEHSSRYGWSTNGGTVYYYGLALPNAPRLTWRVDADMAPEHVREIVQMPPPDEPFDSPLDRERYFNKAELVILVTNSAVEAFLKGPFSPDRTPLQWTQITNFVSTNKTFIDQREANKTVMTTEFDVARFYQWATTNTVVASVLGAGMAPIMIYIADRRFQTATKLAAVRLVNGQTILSSRGLTITTPNPLYTKGHFNQPTPAHLGTTNTSNTRPVSLVCDAYTLLSGAFSDSTSSGPYTARRATDTTVVAAIIAGNVPSRQTYSGGANNLVRLLEAWSGRTYTLNGSLVCLYPSAMATNVFQSPGVYYSAPTRNINFDSNFLDLTRLPPGTPAVSVFK